MYTTPGFKILAAVQKQSKSQVLLHNPIEARPIGLLGVVVFESLLWMLSSYVFAYTTSRMDVELGLLLHRHLGG